MHINEHQIKSREARKDRNWYDVQIYSIECNTYTVYLCMCVWLVQKRLLWQHTRIRREKKANGLNWERKLGDRTSKRIDIRSGKWNNSYTHTQELTYPRIGKSLEHTIEAKEEEEIVWSNNKYLREKNTMPSLVAWHPVRIQLFNISCMTTIEQWWH